MESLIWPKAPWNPVQFSISHPYLCMKYTTSQPPTPSIAESLSVLLYSSPLSIVFRSTKSLANHLLELLLTLGIFGLPVLVFRWL
jgi:hypothetical protein